MPQQADSRHSLEKKVHYTITIVMFHYRWEMSDMRVMRARGKFKPLDSWRSSLMMHCEQSRLSSRSDIQSSRIVLTHLKTIPNTHLWLVGASKYAKPIKQTQSWILQENWTKSGAVHGENKQAFMKLGTMKKRAWFPNLWTFVHDFGNWFFPV